MLGSPFGQYAGVVALIVGVGVIAAWLASLLGAVPPNPTLDAIAYVIIGVIFGTGAGAAVVTNGAERKAEVANTRLDAIQAPSAPIARTIIEGTESRTDRVARLEAADARATEDRQP